MNKSDEVPNVVTAMIIETEEQAQEAMRALTAFYHTPVMPISRYCEALRTWERVIGEKNQRLREELFPGISGLHYGPDQAENERTKKAWEDYRAAKKAYDEGAAPLDARAYALGDIRSGEDMQDAINRTFQQITKSSLLNRLLYCGEKLRTQMCPEHKGVWSGLEGIGSPCPHRCQLTGWIQEDEDQGTPLPVPGKATLVIEGNVVGIVDVSGMTIGKVKL